MTTKLQLKGKETVSFLDLACQVIDRLSLHRVEIPDFIEELTQEMAVLWPKWSPTWDAMPSMGTDVNGDAKSMRALIRAAYAEHQPGWALVHVKTKGTNQSTWMVTDDIDMVHPVLHMTVNDSINRHRNDMAALQYMSLGNLPLTAALTSSQLWDDMRKLINTTLLVTANIEALPVADLITMYGWTNANDAINYMESVTGVRGQASRDIGNALWLEYDRKVP